MKANSRNKDLIVVIPIYKKEPDIYEKCSFYKGIEVLKNRIFSICTFKDLDISYYESVLKNNGIKYSIEYFDKIFFRGVDGYNELLLKHSFYFRYRHYKYLLIYQLDAYIFEDTLNDWMLKKYDYVGAPWFIGFCDYEESRRFWAVGNGGFSLRRIKWFLRELSSPIPLLTPIKFWEEFQITSHKWIYFLLHGFGWGRNNAYSVFMNGNRNEDFLCYYVNSTSWRHHAKMPSILDAARFSFEKSPKYLYETIGGLPVGCHAWMKYQYDVFWSKYISLQDCSSNFK